jgi:hypothetical protein
VAASRIAVSSSLRSSNQATQSGSEKSRPA